MTYSIVARHPESGQRGVAVQSHYFSVGSVVTWAEAGVGAVATQSFAEPAYGLRGLALMRLGVDPVTALQALTGADSERARRQMAFVDATGRVAVHTGALCIEAAGHATGDGVSVQANMMPGNAVWPAMLDAYQTSDGDLAERLTASLEAAEAAGGDIRADAGHVEVGKALLAEIATREPGWNELLRRPPAVDLPKNGEATVTALLGA